ncbi:MAG TPA: DUF1257 domain-containing protein [Gemmatimonadaceae bacterium]
MSHFTKVATQLKRREHIITACRALGYEVAENTDVRGWREQKMKAEIVCRQANGYDIGFVRENENGTYEIVADWYGAGVRAQDFALRVQREYAAQGALAGAKKAGWRNLKRVVEPDGSILITGTRI